MSYTAYSGVRTWDGSEAVSIHGAAAALGASIDGSLCPSFANVAARNAAATALIAAGRVGMMCYCIAEDGHCVYRGLRGWQWLPYNEIVSNPSWGGPALTDGPWPSHPGLALLSTGAVVLPGNGLRRLHINMKASVQASSGAPMNPGVQIIGSGVTPDALMAYVPINGDFGRQTFTATYDFTASGTQTWTLWGYVFGSSAVAQFINMYMKVIDQGPA
jgi:hypothetical protein